jgi:cytochrome c oxidase subunit 3
MASTVLTPTKLTKTPSLGGSGRGPSGFGPGGPGGGGGWEGCRVPARTYRLGMWIGLGGIVMVFAAFTSAMVVRRGMALDWVSIAVPRILWLNTGVLLASSLTLELSRHRLARRSAAQFTRGLCVTLALGLAFLAGQAVAWRELAARGVYLATNPSSSFFYVLTAAHGLHLAGGILALAYVAGRAGRIAQGLARRTPLEVAAIYWHFMDALWIYIFFLLTRWS